MLERFEQFSMAISNIYQTIQKIQRMEMEKYGLKGAHTQCLIMLWQNPDGITMGKLCELCDKDKAAISRTVAELERRGLVERRNLNKTGYRANLVLTESGEQAAKAVSSLAAAAANQAGAALTQNQREIFYDALNLISDNLDRLYREGIDALQKQKLEETDEC